MSFEVGGFVLIKQSTVGLSLSLSLSVCVMKGMSLQGT